MEKAEEDLCTSLFGCKLIEALSLIEFDVRLFKSTEKQPASVDDNGGLHGEDYRYVVYRRGRSYP